MGRQESLRVPPEFISADQRKSVFPTAFFEAGVRVMFKKDGYEWMGAAFDVYSQLGYLINIGHRGGLEWIESPGTSA